MTVMAMEVISAEKHPNADALRLYKIKIEQKEVEVIANLDRIYEIGDVVAIALVGCGSGFCNMISEDTVF